MAMLEAAGVIVIVARLAGFTVSVVVAEMPPEAAVIVLDPAVSPDARPFEPDALLMPATAVFDEPHVTEVVTFCVEPSE